MRSTISAVAFVLFCIGSTFSQDLSKFDKYIADGQIPPRTVVPENNIIPGSDGIQRCQTDQYAAIRQITHPRDKDAIRAIRESASSKVANFIGCDGANSIVIPVAVHYDASFDCTNTQCLIDAALGNIAAMNEDFAATNADISYYNQLNAACPAGYPLDIVSDGTCITFCLATQNHPAGEGIVDGEAAITVGQYTWTGGPDAPNFAGYFNIFVEANTGGLGIAAAPGQGNGDGVQVDASAFGAPGINCSSGSALNSDATYNLGRTLTHEAGHYFDLFHTFQGGCGDGDTGTFSGQVGVINDTPATSAPFFGCPTIPNPGTCADAPGSNCASMFAQITNYMDYTDDACMVMFTMDQAAVMNGWANSLNFVSDATVCVPAAAPTMISACRLTPAFGPVDGSIIEICTDNGNTIDFIDMSTNGPTSWDWTFAVTNGDLVLGSNMDNVQNPSLAITGGTSGTIDVTLEVCDAVDGCTTVTQTYTVNVVSGANCSNECEFTLNLTDTFGDGWNGATVEIFQNGVSVGVFGGAFTTGTTDGPFTLNLTDGAMIDVVQTSGGFPGEEGFTLLDPFGVASAQLVGGAPVTQSFTASCTAPTCDDGIQNGNETGIDCGGPDCGDCCGNGIQDSDETGVDCGGMDCTPCPTCMTGFEELLNETFDACVMPAGWTVTATDGGIGNILFTDGPNDVPGGQPPSPDFAGCIATIDDDAADDIGVGCIISPMIDLSTFANGSLTFDWQNNDFAGAGDFIVEVFDGTAWVQVFIEENDAFGTNETIDLSAFTNSDFQIRFCYDDEGEFAWGAGFDNVAVCGQSLESCGAEVGSFGISNGNN